jgi:hypothetical protein
VAVEPMTAHKRCGRRAGRHACPACAGSGLFSPAVPSCTIKACRARWIVVERCDACEQFVDDLAAALSRFNVAGWFQCDSGGWHALADSGSGL